MSNLGRIKSLGNKTMKKEHIRKFKPNKKTGYIRINLCKNGVVKFFLLHRIVAEVFIPNPNNLPQVNHKDENKQNNCSLNLEWVTAEENMNYGTRNERAGIILKNRPDLSIKIECLDLKTNKVIYFPSIAETARQFNTSPSAIQWALKESKIPYKKRYIFKKIGK